MNIIVLVAMDRYRPVEDGRIERTVVTVASVVVVVCPKVDNTGSVSVPVTRVEIHHSTMLDPLKYRPVAIRLISFRYTGEY